MRNISGPRRFGFTAIVICRTFFVVHIQNIARPRRLGAPVIVICVTFYVGLISQIPHRLLVFNLIFCHRRLPVAQQPEGEGFKNNAKARRRDAKGLQYLVLERHLNQSFLCSAIPENCAFLAKFSEPSFRMTNEKFSMTDFQSALLVATCRAATWRCSFRRRGSHPRKR
jgi:hypothetical protein